MSRTITIYRFLTKSEDWIPVAPDGQYKQITARLWGKGLTLRGEVPGAAIAAPRQLCAKAGQFLISRIDARHGAFGIVPEELDGALVSNDFPCFDIDASTVLPHYFEWYSRTPEFVDLCRRASEGPTNRVRVKEEKLLKMAVPLPSLDEQRRIVQRLDCVAGGVNRVRSLRSDNVNQSQALIRALIFGSSESPHRRVPFGEIARQRPLDIIVEPTGDYQFAGVFSFGRGMFISERRLGSEFSYAKLSKVRAGDFVYPKLMAWEGALAVAPEECDGCSVSPEFPVFEIDSEVMNPIVVDAYFRNPSVWPTLNGTSKGTNLRRRRLHPNDLLAHSIPVPPAQTQRIIKELLHRYNPFPLRGRYEDLDALIPAMLHEIFSGRAKAA